MPNSPLTDRLSDRLETAAGAVLMGIMLLTIADIAGRMLGRPVPGAYEIVSIAGGLVIGLALPGTSKAGIHVVMDILLARLSRGIRSVLVVTTRFIGMVVFSVAGCGMVMMGNRLRGAGEVTAVLSLPYYYVAYALGMAFFVQVVVLATDVAGAIRRRRE